MHEAIKMLVLLDILVDRYTSRIYGMLLLLGGNG